MSLAGGTAFAEGEAKWLWWQELGHRGVWGEPRLAFQMRGLCPSVSLALGRGQILQQQQLPGWPLIG